MDKLDIANEMRQLDTKNRDFYDSLDDDERKKFSNYLMLRWGSNVSGIPELQQYYLCATNERLNKHFFDIAKHPKLQWLLATTISPNMGVQRHDWLTYNSKVSKNKRVKLMLELYPELKDDDAELLAKKIPDAELKQLLTRHGWTDKNIKEAMK
jgi:hypothetical protein